MSCAVSGFGWRPIEDEALWVSDGGDFLYELEVPEQFGPWPAGTVAWIEISGMAGQWTAAVDGQVLRWRVEQTLTTPALVPNRAVWRLYLQMPTPGGGDVDDFLWFKGEVRRVD